MLTHFYSYYLFYLLDDGVRNGDDNSDEEESDSGMSEVRFVPEDRGFLDAMYHAMTVWDFSFLGHLFLHILGLFKI